MIVRWPVAPQALLKDNFYGSCALCELLYKPGFIDGFLEDIKRLDKIIKAQTYNASEYENNLLFQLVKNGFYGVSTSYQKDIQYIWVNPQGYIIRVKKNPNSQSWHFTVGLTYENPFIWNADKARRVKKHKDIKENHTRFSNQMGGYDNLATYQYNEIFKIIVDGELIMIAPAGFTSFYWNRSCNKGQLMGSAHRSLTQRVNLGSSVEQYIGF